MGWTARPLAAMAAEPAAGDAVMAAQRRRNGARRMNDAWRRGDGRERVPSRRFPHSSTPAWEGALQSTPESASKHAPEDTPLLAVPAQAAAWGDEAGNLEDDPSDCTRGWVAGSDS